MGITIEMSAVCLLWSIHDAVLSFTQWTSIVYPSTTLVEELSKYCFLKAWEFFSPQFWITITVKIALVSHGLGKQLPSNLFESLTHLTFMVWFSPSSPWPGGMAQSSHCSWRWPYLVPALMLSDSQLPVISTPGYLMPSFGRHKHLHTYAHVHTHTFFKMKNISN